MRPTIKPSSASLRGVGLILVTLCLILTAAASPDRSSPAFRDPVVTAPPAVDVPATRRAVVQAYARYCFALYGRCETEAMELRAAIRRFCAKPDAAGLADCRRAWLAARELYGRTEVLRFYDGPIDNARTGVETFLNAWPLDENYIDAPKPGMAPGIIQDAKRFPNLVGAVLTVANERGGEANVSIGWHAIEYLLWGVDQNAKGPGTRPVEHFVDGKEPHAARRRTYLLALADLLVEHLGQVRAAWAPGTDNYRRGFVAGDDKEALRKLLAGMIVLSGFEMAGERLAVAYETKDQEQEHSCFSDNTHRDFITNQRGVLDLYRGEGFGMRGVGVRDLALKVAPKLVETLDRALADTDAAVQALPTPFDQGILGADDTPGRRAVLRSIESLEIQTEALAALALACGYEIPVEPGAGR